MRIILSLLLALFLIHPAHADDGSSCDFNSEVYQSNLLQRGFVDSTQSLMSNPIESQKARQILSNVQRIFLNASSQSILMYGWGVIAPISQDQAQHAFLAQRMTNLKQEAERAGHEFEYHFLSGLPMAVQFTALYKNKKWPEREMGLESVLGENCFLSLRMSGNKLPNNTKDKALVQDVEAELLRIRDNNVYAVSANQSLVTESLQMKQLPDFYAERFWAIALPTFIIAFLCWIIIGRAARALDNQHTVYYFRVMTAAWFGYAIIISVLKNNFIDPVFPMGLEHYFYAALMIVVQALGLIFGPYMSLLSVSLILAHALRSVLFMLLGYTEAPQVVWFDVGLMVLMAFYILIYGFKKRGSLPRVSSKNMNIIDRQRH